MIIDLGSLIFKHLVVVKATLGMDVTSSILRFKVFIIFIAVFVSHISNIGPSIDPRRCHPNSTVSF